MTRLPPLLQSSFETELLQILDLWPFYLTFTSYLVIREHSFFRRGRGGGGGSEESL